MILITARARLRADHRDRALAAAADMRRDTTAEAGCIDYRFWIASDDPDSILLFEQWTDQDALTTHMSAPHMVTFIEVFGPAVDGGMEVTRFEIASSGPLV